MAFYNCQIQNQWLLQVSSAHKFCLFVDNIRFESEFDFSMNTRLTNDPARNKSNQNIGPEVARISTVKGVKQRKVILFNQVMHAFF